MAMAEPLHNFCCYSDGPDTLNQRDKILCDCRFPRDVNTVSVRFTMSVCVTTSAKVGPSPCSGGVRSHRPSSHRWSTFHFPLLLSCLPSHLVPIPSITCCVFIPLFPPMSLSVIVSRSAHAWYAGIYRVLFDPFIVLFCWRWFMDIKRHRCKSVFVFPRLTSLLPVHTSLQCVLCFVL